MISANDATEKVAYDLLSAGGDIGAPVYQDVPDDTPPPVIIIGDIDSEPLPGLKNDPDRRGTLTMVTITEGDERKPLLALQVKIEQRLNAISTIHEGWKVRFSFAGDTAQLDPNGANYIGNSRFDFLALRA